MSIRENAVTAIDITKSFRIPVESSNGLKQKIINLLKGKKGYRSFTPLKNVSLEVKEGEFYGILGRNGSGKSTLLKILAGIYSPNEGSVDIRGRLVPFIELGVGFNPELSGKENVFLNGALLGFSHDEMEQMYDDIVEFAELKDFMEESLKNYSSGMQVRLAFSIAIKAEGDILLLDEVLAVGDEAFQRKCFEYFAQLKKEKKTVILVTHDMSNVERFCDRVLVIDGGKALGVYSPQKGKRVYEQLNRGPHSFTARDEPDMRWGTGYAKIESVNLNDQDSPGLIEVAQGDALSIKFRFNSKDNPKIILGLAIYDESGTVIAGPNSSSMKFTTANNIEYRIPALSLNSGKYYLRAALYAEDHTTEYDHLEQAAEFYVTTDYTQHGKVNLFGEWEAVGVTNDN